MNKFNLVDISSPEFEIKILDILSKYQPKSKLSSRFIPLPDGWIRDLSTGLDWGKSSTKGMNFDSAKEYCTKEGGRLPSRTELQTIQDLDKVNPCIDASIFTDAKCDYYWTSTKYAGASNAFWCVSFHYGYVGDRYESLDYYVRPVRASQ